MFKIGEFSTIARISDVTLRHYDDIGLFKPIRTDPETGYRYYSIQQLPRLNRILALRDLGLTLDQIARLMEDDITTEEIQGMLKLRHTQIEHTLDQEMRRLRRVASRLDQVKQHGNFPGPDLVIKEVPAAHWLSIREPVPFIRNSGYLYWQVINAVVEAEVSGLTYLMAQYHDPLYRTAETDFELGWIIDGPRDITLDLPEGRTLTVKPLEAIPQALTCIHAGPWSTIHHGFAAIGAYIETNRLHIAGKPRELYLNLAPPERGDELVVEVQIPISTA